MFRKTDKELRDQCGMDHYLLIRFIRMCLYLFVTFGVLSLAIICPLNALDQRSLSGLNLLTFGNILDTQRLWGHLVLTVLYSGKYSKTDYLQHNIIFGGSHHH
jgi:hypothetical protein